MIASQQAKVSFFINRYHMPFNVLSDINKLSISFSATLATLISKTLENTSAYPEVKLVFLAQVPIVSMQQVNYFNHNLSVLHRRFRGLIPSVYQTNRLIAGKNQPKIKSYNQLIKEIVSKYKRARFTDLSPHLMHIHNKEGQSFYRDDDHLSEYAALYLLPFLREDIEGF